MTVAFYFSTSFDCLPNSSISIVVSASIEVAIDVNLTEGELSAVWAARASATDYRAASTVRTPFLALVMSVAFMDRWLICWLTMRPRR